MADWTPTGNESWNGFQSVRTAGIPPSPCRRGDPRDQKILASSWMVGSLGDFAATHRASRTQPCWPRTADWGPPSTVCREFRAPSIMSQVDENGVKAWPLGRRQHPVRACRAAAGEPACRRDWNALPQPSERRCFLERVARDHPQATRRLRGSWEPVACLGQSASLGWPIR